LVRNGDAGVVFKIAFVVNAYNPGLGKDILTPIFGLSQLIKLNVPALFAQEGKYGP
jgi:hypothetical protein